MDGIDPPQVYKSRRKMMGRSKASGRDPAPTATRPGPPQWNFTRSHSTKGSCKYASVYYALTTKKGSTG